MIIAEAMYKRIRGLLNENETDTVFTNEYLKPILHSAENENHALYLLWTQKAGFESKKNAGDIKRIQAGGESIEKYTSSDYVDVCLKIAEGYRKAWSEDKKTQSGSRLMYKQKSEEVLW